MTIRKAAVASALALVGAWLSLTTLAQRTPGTGTAAAETEAAAKKFLATLDEAQRRKVQFDFRDAAQRKRWSNLPTGIFRREGLRMGDLSQPQREAAMAVLAAALSRKGYEKVVQIVEADEVLRKGDGGGRGSRGPAFGRDEYYLSFLGQPSAGEPWIIQFGGHHLGINVTLAGDNGTLAPSHTGAQPAIYEIEGKTIRPLGHETEKAFALINSLNEAQRKQAVLGVQMRDLVLGPGRDGETIQPEGIEGSDLTGPQRDMLLDLAGEWTGIMHEAVAKSKMEEMRRNVADTWFAWSGPTDKPGTAYFRIQGTTEVSEYAPQRLGGDDTKHIHTSYRDPTNEYPAKWSKP
jgi:hypothetical protein